MRFHLLALLTSGVVVASSACSVDATAPLSRSTPESADMSRGTDNPLAGIGKSWGPNDSASYSFTIDPTRSQLLSFAEHTLELPANAICQADSGYGAAFWDAPCITERRPITVTAKVRGSSKGLPRVELGPAVRFSPDVYVTLSLYVRGKKTRDVTDWRILYCADPVRADCVDESLLDPTLTTFVDRPAHTVYRRIKHFSGYLVAE